MAVDHRLLNGMKVASPRHSIRRGTKPLNGDNMTTIELIKELNACIDRLVADFLRFSAANQDGARAAITLGANEFRPRQLQVAAQKIGERGKRRVASDFEAPSVDVENQIIAHAIDPTGGREKKLSTTALKRGYEAW